MYFFVYVLSATSLSVNFFECTETKAVSLVSVTAFYLSVLTVISGIVFNAYQFYAVGNLGRLLKLIDFRRN